MPASFLGALAIGTGLLAFTPDQASAKLTYDLRAVDVTGSPVTCLRDSKHVVVTVNSLVTFEIWVRITSASGIGVFGYQNSVFSILSSNGGSILGNVGLFQAIAPWNSASAVGSSFASLDADSDFDNGTNLTNSLTGLPKARSDNTAAGGGDPSFLNAQTTAVHVPSVNFQPVTIGTESGYEFEIGTVTFTMTAPGLTDPTVPIGINVRPGTALLTGGTKAVSASFVESGVLKSGSTGAFAVGADVVLYLSALDVPCIPEPSAFHMVLLGELGLAGCRRGGIRRA